MGEAGAGTQRIAPAAAAPERTLAPGAAAALAYAAAALLGGALALALLPPDFLLPEAGRPWKPVGDAAQHIVAQRYFLRDPAWHWPPLLAPHLGTAEGGTNIAFADGIPLLALALKPLAAWLPPGFHGIGLFYGLAMLAQPLAALWCLRGSGERRLLPGLGAALAAASMPAWLNRYGHAALMGHFLLLLGLGLYLRLVGRQGARLWGAAAALAVAALLVHPYLAAMVLALLGAVPLTRLLRPGAPGVGAALAGCGAAGATVLLAMAAFGYLGATGEGGYGQFAMNLLSPVWPHRSGLLPGLVAAEVDATGHGGWEGYNWLGAGLLAGVAAALLLRPRALAVTLRRHAGLALALLALTLLALSHRVGAGSAVVLDLGAVPAVLGQFRASGRFFWPVAYALLIGVVAVLARHPRRGLGAALALAVGLLQFADAAPLRAALRDWAAARPGWTLDAPALRALFARHARLTLLPSWSCIARGAERDYAEALEALVLASETALPVSTMYVARWRGAPPACRDAALAAAPLGPGELRLILPGAVAQALPLVPRAAERCVALGEAVACAAAAAGR
ncbi:hypothetical protein GCM10010964_00650 [Caldovatus sediminis]|uniref:Glycosyltransferase RgtA/B/C/D-like domain-containing protein n=1 Tax=Caldovatus sediminis TaxID=2041189 RepID=A0A8J3EAR9_9PROT|nr:DUF6311 domain-containing protein [Caldovatus sediminis]GGG16227.1 hypothetical protein GCM10010964_00650 [Caldovatus sediminis]